MTRLQRIGEGEHARDSGFTLIELVVVLTLIGVVGLVFADAAYQTIKLTSSTSDSLGNSSARARLTGRLSDDVHAAIAVGAGATLDPACATPPDATAYLWSSTGTAATASAANPFVVTAYSMLPASGDASNKLLRETCTKVASGGLYAVSSPTTEIGWSDGTPAPVTVTANSVKIDLPLDHAGALEHYVVTLVRRTT